jgi:hypothetical protein
LNSIEIGGGDYILMPVNPPSMVKLDPVMNLPASEEIK